MNSTNNNCIIYVENSINFSTEESRTIGIIHLFLCSFFIISYLLVLSAIVSNSSLFKIHAYRIMFHLGVMDIGELVAFFFALALMMITNSPIDYLFSKITNALANGFYPGTASMILILAINRLIVLLDISFPYWLNENLFYNVLLILAYGWSLINSILFILPNMGAILLPNGFIYECGNGLFSALDMAVIQNMSILGVLGITWALYVIIVVYLIIQRHYFLNDSRVIVGMEGQLLLQFMFVCIYKSVITALFTWYPTSNQLPYAIFLTFALIECGYAPYLYFFVNRTLRHYIIKILRGYFGVYTTSINTAAVNAW